MSDGPYTAAQPKPGECVGHCGHDLSGRTHWYQPPEPIEFTRPDESTGWLRWLIQCEACHETVQSGGDPLVRGDFVWPADGRNADGELIASPIVEHPRQQP